MTKATETSEWFDGTADCAICDGRYWAALDVLELPERQTVWLCEDHAERLSTPALCRYPDHRSSDWVGESGKTLCGICHPGGTVAAISGELEPRTP